uniref:Ribosomal protein S11 n=1 Tax=Drypetes longifolia TaxID=1504425 RepID=A0A7G8QDD9_9ROSI|nr:ribosomal protein S11 [Drypetes longifolia]QNK04797.1 ribosomal protein S11 [Drypetes longifolia]
MVKFLQKVSRRRNRRRRIVWSLKNPPKIKKGIIHVQASFNNTIVTVTDVRGRAVSWSSAGTCRFKGPRRGTPFAAYVATEDAIQPLMDLGMRRAEVRIRGPGPGRDGALRTIKKIGIKFNFVRDVTPIAHNGCRPPNKRRL